MGAVTVPDMGGIMNPFLWLLFVLAAVVVLTIVAALALGVVKMWRELPLKRGAIGARLLASEAEGRARVERTLRLHQGS